MIVHLVRLEIKAKKEGWDVKENLEMREIRVNYITVEQCMSVVRDHALEVDLEMKGMLALSAKLDHMENLDYLEMMESEEIRVSQDHLVLQALGRQMLCTYLINREMMLNKFATALENPASFPAYVMAGVVGIEKARVVT